MPAFYAALSRKMIITKGLKRDWQKAQL